VSQYVATMQGSGPLYDELHELLGGEFEPGPIHRFFAELAGVPVHECCDRGERPRCCFEIASADDGVGQK
jgi:hypothetical protein